MRNEISCTKLQLPPEPLTRGLPPPDPRSLCPLSSTEFVEPPPRIKFLGTPLDRAARRLCFCSRLFSTVFTAPKSPFSLSSAEFVEPPHSRTKFLGTPLDRAARRLCCCSRLFSTVFIRHTTVCAGGIGAPLCLSRWEITVSRTDRGCEASAGVMDNGSAGKGGDTSVNGAESVQ